MFPVYICEDNIVQLSYFEKIIKNYLLMEGLDIEVVCAVSTPEEVLKTQVKFSSSGLYFLDIELKCEMDGFSLAEEIRKKDPRGYIVFITTHSELSYVSFERHVEAMDYILKDYPEQLPARIIECVRKALDLYSSAQNNVQKTLSLKIGSRQIYVPVNDVYCIKSSYNAHKLQLVTDYAIYEFYGTLQDVLTKLDSSFFLCHKSCIVNLGYIIEIDRSTYNIKLKNGQLCPLSTRSYFAIKKRLQKYSLDQA